MRKKARCRARHLRHAQTWDGITDEEILDRDGWRCQIQGCKRRPIRKDAKFPHPRSKSVDHIVPLSPRPCQLARLGANNLRLRNGLTAEEADAQMAAIVRAGTYDFGRWQRGAAA